MIEFLIGLLLFLALIWGLLAFFARWGWRGLAVLTSPVWLLAVALGIAVVLFPDPPAAPAHVAAAKASPASADDRDFLREIGAVPASVDYSDFLKRTGAFSEPAKVVVTEASPLHQPQITPQIVAGGTILPDVPGPVKALWLQLPFTSAATSSPVYTAMFWGFMALASTVGWFRTMREG